MLVFSTPLPSRRHPGTVLAGLLLAATLSTAWPPGAQADDAPPPSDPKAIAVADRVMEALGGRQAWEATHFIQFDFLGRRKHLWDKWTGRHRLEGTTRDGKSFLVIENLNTHEGRAWLDGQELSGPPKDDLLKNAYAAWVNDTYWLLMPYKLRDPGVHLEYAGEETIDGNTYDKLLLTFDHVGLTPGDRYWAYINRRTGLMDRWAYILESQDPTGPPTAWEWKDWHAYGAIRLSPTRVQVGGDRTLSLAPIEVTDQAPPGAFDGP